MKVQHIIGADLSKKTIDLVCRTSGDYIQIKNDISGFKTFLKWFGEQKVSAQQTLIVMEHTGLYSYLFEKFLHQHNIFFKKVSALEIKRSAGLVRGKSDKIDARRIADYGYEKKEKLSATHYCQRTNFNLKGSLWAYPNDEMFTRISKNISLKGCLCLFSRLSFPVCCILLMGIIFFCISSQKTFLWNK